MISYVIIIWWFLVCICLVVDVVVIVVVVVICHQLLTSFVWKVFGDRLVRILGAEQTVK